MTILARLALICVLAVTSLGLGAARGQPGVGDEVVLCAGGAITVMRMGPDGQPVAQTHICPDMAPAFLAGFDAPPPLPARPAGRAEASLPTPDTPDLFQRASIRGARGPPPRAA